MLIHQMLLLLHLEMELRQQAASSLQRAQQPSARLQHLDEVLALNEQLNEVGDILSALVSTPVSRLPIGAVAAVAGGATGGPPRVISQILSTSRNFSSDADHSVAPLRQVLDVTPVTTPAMTPTVTPPVRSRFTHYAAHTADDDSDAASSDSSGPVSRFRREAREAVAAQEAQEAAARSRTRGVVHRTYDPSQTQEGQDNEVRHRRHDASQASRVLDHISSNAGLQRPNSVAQSSTSHLDETDNAEDTYVPVNSRVLLNRSRAPPSTVRQSTNQPTQAESQVSLATTPRDTYRPIESRPQNSVLPPTTPQTSSPRRASEDRPNVSQPPPRRDINSDRVVLPSITSANQTPRESVSSEPDATPSSRLPLASSAHQRALNFARRDVTHGSDTVNSNRSEQGRSQEILQTNRSVIADAVNTGEEGRGQSIMSQTGPQSATRTSEADSDRGVFTVQNTVVTQPRQMPNLPNRESVRSDYRQPPQNTIIAGGLQQPVPATNMSGGTQQPTVTTNVSGGPRQQERILNTTSQNHSNFSRQTSNASVRPRYRERISASIDVTRRPNSRHSLDIPQTSRYNGGTSSYDTTGREGGLSSGYGTVASGEGHRATGAQAAGEKRGKQTTQQSISRRLSQPTRTISTTAPSGNVIRPTAASRLRAAKTKSRHDTNVTTTPSDGRAAQQSNSNRGLIQSRQPGRQGNHSNPRDDLLPEGYQRPKRRSEIAEELMDLTAGRQRTRP